MTKQTELMLVELSEKELEAISGGGGSLIDLDVENVLNKNDVQVVVIGSKNKNG